MRDERYWVVSVFSDADNHCGFRFGRNGSIFPLAQQYFLQVPDLQKENFLTVFPKLLETR